MPTFGIGLPGFEVERAACSRRRVYRPPSRGKSTQRSSRLWLAEFKEQFSDQGIELVGSTPEAAAAYVKVQLENWTRMLTETGLRAAPLAR